MTSRSQADKGAGNSAEAIDISISRRVSGDKTTRVHQEEESEEEVKLEEEEDDAATGADDDEDELFPNGFFDEDTI